RLPIAQTNLFDDVRDRPDVEGLSERIAASTQLTRMIEYRCKNGQSRTSHIQTGLKFCGTKSLWAAGKNQYDDPVRLPLVRKGGQTGIMGSACCTPAQSTLASSVNGDHGAAGDAVFR